jgi:hypothetical protein
MEVPRHRDSTTAEAYTEISEGIGGSRGKPREVYNGTSIGSACSGLSVYCLPEWAVRNGEAWEGTVRGWKAPATPLLQRKTGAGKPLPRPHLDSLA